MTTRDPAVANARSLYATKSQVEALQKQTLRSITASTDTPTSTDNGKLVTIDTTSGAVTITINTSLGLSVGERIDFVWIGAATSVTFSASSVTLNATPGLKLRARYSSATLVCIGTNSYVLIGDLIA